MSMKIGERCKLTCPPDYAYGARWVPPPLACWLWCNLWFGDRLQSSDRQLLAGRVWAAACIRCCGIHRCLQSADGVLLVFRPVQGRGRRDPSQRHPGWVNRPGCSLDALHDDALQAVDQACMHIRSTAAAAAQHQVDSLRLGSGYSRMCGAVHRDLGARQQSGLYQVACPMHPPDLQCSMWSCWASTERDTACTAGSARPARERQQRMTHTPGS